MNGENTRNKQTPSLDLLVWIATLASCSLTCTTADSSAESERKSSFSFLNQSKVASKISIGPLGSPRALHSAVVHGCTNTGREFCGMMKEKYFGTPKEMILA